MSDLSIAEQPAVLRAPELQSKLAVARPPELLSIQYLRAFAAIAVVFFHAAERAGSGFGVGAAGVDIFFVISGFIMWVINSRNASRPLVFLARRAARIVPLYWLVTLTVAGMAIAAPQLFPNLRPTVDHVIKSLLFYPHTDSTGAVEPLVVPGWTLNYEVFFYLVFAASLIVPSRYRPLTLTASLGLFVVTGHFLHPSGPVLAIYTSALLLEFLAGVWLGRAWTNDKLPGVVAGFGCVAFGVGLFAIVTASGVDIEPQRILLWGLPAFLIVAGAVTIDRAGFVPNWPILKFLGDASYSIYLVHGLAISMAARTLTATGANSKPALFAVSVVGGIAVGSVCYLVVERPLLRLFHPSRRKVPQAIVRTVSQSSSQG